MLQPPTPTQHIHVQYYCIINIHVLEFSVICIAGTTNQIAHSIQGTDDPVTSAIHVILGLFIYIISESFFKCSVSMMFPSEFESRSSIAHWDFLI